MDKIIIEIITSIKPYRREVYRNITIDEINIPDNIFTITPNKRGIKLIGFLPNGNQFIIYEDGFCPEAIKGETVYF